MYLNRRQFITMAAVAAAGVVAGQNLFLPDARAGHKLNLSQKGRFSVQEKQTSYNNAAHYNNFYEFSTNKEDVADLASGFHTRPWTITIEGHVKKPGVYDIDKLISLFPLEERIYRFRCVEGWSMVLPWAGFSLADFIRRLEPSSKARFVKFTTLYNPKEMPGQHRDILEWPYIEGLRMDEAMNPLTLIAAGMYGEVLPNQNGAPLRLVVPWKYGFKSIKSIIKLSFVEDMPANTWAISAPGEYGFYANVNPHVPHPRWTQSRERRLGEYFKRDTLMFNGYSDYVSVLYTGMDLKKFF